MQCAALRQQPDRCAVNVSRDVAPHVNPAISRHLSGLGRTDRTRCQMLGAGAGRSSPKSRSRVKSSERASSSFSLLCPPALLSGRRLDHPGSRSVSAGWLMTLTSRSRRRKAARRSQTLRGSGCPASVSSHLFGSRIPTFRLPALDSRSPGSVARVAKVLLEVSTGRKVIDTYRVLKNLFQKLVTSARLGTHITTTTRDLTARSVP